MRKRKNTGGKDKAMRKDTGDDQMDAGDDQMDTDEDVYKTKVFDKYYIRADYPDPKDNNMIYINASGASYDALEFLTYSNDSKIAMDKCQGASYDALEFLEFLEQDSDRQDSNRLCVALQMKKREPNNSINQTQFDAEHDKVILLHLYRV